MAELKREREKFDLNHSTLCRPVEKLYISLQRSKQFALKAFHRVPFIDSLMSTAAWRKWRRGGEGKKILGQDRINHWLFSWWIQWHFSRWDPSRTHCVRETTKWIIDVLWYRHKMASSWFIYYAQHPWTPALLSSTSLQAIIFKYRAFIGSVGQITYAPRVWPRYRLTRNMQKHFWRRRRKKRN